MKLNQALKNSRQPRAGMAMMIVLALLVIVLIYVGANARTLHHLGRDLRLVEQKQTLRLQKMTLPAAPVSQVNTSSPAQPHE